MDYTLIDERIISGVGLLRIPKDEKYRDFVIYAQVIRKPTSEFLNLDWFPPKGLYGRITLRYQEYVVDSFLMEFENFAHRLTSDISAQNLIAINCAYAGVLQSIFNLADCISECVPFNITNNVELMQSLQLTPDEFIVSCQTNSAIALQLYALEYVQCGDESLQPPPPPPPPPNFEQRPSGERIADISPPYDDSDDVTDPNLLDEQDPGIQPDYPVGNDCQIVEIVFDWVTPIDPPGNQITFRVFGPVNSIDFQETSAGAQVLISARGSANSANLECQDDAEIIQAIAFGGAQPGDVQYSLVSVTPL